MPRPVPKRRGIAAQFDAIAAGQNPQGSCLAYWYGFFQLLYHKSFGLFARTYLSPNDTVRKWVIHTESKGGIPMNPRNHQDALAAHPRLRRFLFADDAVLFFGPFALLWRGQVRACLPYLPLAVLAVAAHGVLSFGIARQSVGMVQGSTAAILLSWAGGFAVGGWKMLHQNPAAPARRRHPVWLLSGISAVAAALAAAMQIGAVL